MKKFGIFFSMSALLCLSNICTVNAVQSLSKTPSTPPGTTVKNQAVLTIKPKTNPWINPKNPKRPVFIGSRGKIQYGEQTKYWERVKIYKHKSGKTFDYLDKSPRYTKYYTVWLNRKYGYYMETPNLKRKGALKMGVSLTPRRFYGITRLKNILKTPVDIGKQKAGGSFVENILSKITGGNVSAGGWVKGPVTQGHYGSGDTEVIVTNAGSNYTGYQTTWVGTTPEGTTIITITDNIKGEGYQPGSPGVSVPPENTPADTDPALDSNATEVFTNEGQSTPGQNGGGNSGYSWPSWATGYAGEFAGHALFYDSEGNIKEANGAVVVPASDPSTDTDDQSTDTDNTSDDTVSNDTSSTDTTSDDSSEDNGDNDDGSDGDDCVGDDCGGGEEGYIDTGDPCFFCSAMNFKPGANVEKQGNIYQNSGDPARPDFGQSQMSLDPKNPGGPVMNNAKPDMGQSKTYLDPKDPGGPVMQKQGVNNGQNNMSLDPKDPGGPVMNGQGNSTFNKVLNQMQQLLKR